MRICVAPQHTLLLFVDLCLVETFRRKSEGLYLVLKSFVMPVDVPWPYRPSYHHGRYGDSNGRQSNPGGNLRREKGRGGGDSGKAR